MAGKTITLLQTEKQFSTAFQEFYLGIKHNQNMKQVFNVREEIKVLALE